MLSTLYPYKEKIWNGKKLYRRPKGIKVALTTGENTIVQPVPFAHTKIIGIEVVGCEAMDVVDLQVLDNENGDYTTVPSYPLPDTNFADAVVLPKDFYQRESPFDADLYNGMQIEIKYTSLSDKTIGINFIWDEVKP